MSTTGLQVAKWVLANAGAPVTHLKLQKLVFYSYGAALAFDLESELGALHSFEAWEHGPVSRDVWDEYKHLKRQPIAAPQVGEQVRVSESLAQVLNDTLCVYGGLDAWSLRQQTHLERPWLEARERGAERIDPIALRSHFKKKLTKAPVVPPEYFLHTASFTLDGVPGASFGSLHELAETIRAARASAAQQ